MPSTKRLGEEKQAQAINIEDEQHVELSTESVPSGDQSEHSSDESALRVPPDLPILPLRGLVVYPQTAMPLNIGQKRSIRLVDEAVSGDRLIGLVASRNPELETPEPQDIYTVGTMAAILRLFRAPDGTIRLLVQGLARIRVDEYIQSEPFLRARVTHIPEIVEEGNEVEALKRMVVEQFSKLAELVPSVPSDLVNSTLNTNDPLQIVYAIATYIRLSLEDYQRILELDSVSEKLRLLLQILSKEIEVQEISRKIQSQTQSAIEQGQREFYLREQLKAIRRALGEEDEQFAEVEQFRQRIAAAQMPEEALREAERELERMSRLPTASAEYGVIRTYLDWMTSLPWAKRTEDNLNIRHARQVLDADHYGLKDVKERILEFLAVRRLRAERYGKAVPKSDDQTRRDRQGAILCFVGPPGVGKTSLGASIARAMGRKFTRMSLGGVRDEAEIRGFRRTYIGAMPGRIIQTLRRVETRNPVIMLDEIDKLGRDFRGDPSAALLEVLDPEQNYEFRDHYLDVPFDLSEVLFITTANELDPIPPPLRDRMEIITLSGYTEQEKLQIAARYLVPRQIRENGLLLKEVQFTQEALLTIIRDYTREAGVRNLERAIGSSVRKVATRIAEGEVKRVRVTPKAVRSMLGKPRFGYGEELSSRTDLPGVATGLSVTAFGGDVLFVEATHMPGNKGFQYTGQLGEVMQESARAAFSYVRAHAQELGVSPDYFEKHDIHLHVPAGAVPKDGPSAGVTMVTALASLMTSRPVKHNVAMTGEITLRGKVLPVGGIKDKVLAAHRFGVDTVILPRRNQPDLDDLPEDVRDAMTFILVDDVKEVLDAALSPKID
ncbi:MAG: endopeptidase La [Candidatus Thermofonsia Clade 1 bacterium]|jgi:ATP-dependent Lon protease|uniref:Lon protease n=1 Tax=Candidatus Thermofonsia Clade 1 bacterium TaxID=2364210 RepID=A0A2M8PGQ1_9CHLR|nr:MAG: endopeptidase La [Candidatus Thermofonsia Clade 1 bacterium]